MEVCVSSISISARKPSSWPTKERSFGSTPFLPSGERPFKASTRHKLPCPLDETAPMPSLPMLITSYWKKKKTTIKKRNDVTLFRKKEKKHNQRNESNETEQTAQHTKKKKKKSNNGIYEHEANKDETWCFLFCCFACAYIVRTWSSDGTSGTYVYSLIHASNKKNYTKQQSWNKTIQNKTKRIKPRVYVHRTSTILQTASTRGWSTHPSPPDKRNTCLYTYQKISTKNIKQGLSNDKTNEKKTPLGKPNHPNN